MPDRPVRHRRLAELTTIPTAPGREHRVLAWVERWASRRSDLRARRDRFGNLLLTQRSRGRRPPPVLAVAHTDHPGLVVESVDGRSVTAQLRGGVRAAYLDGARVELFDRDGSARPGRVDAHDPDTGSTEIRLDRTAPALQPGDLGRWRFHPNRLGISGDRLRAHACDDLAGVAAALEALDRARRRDDLAHFGVLLTRAEEVGFVGAIGAARSGIVPAGARLVSIECSRASADAPVGGGPVVRVGDASTVFDRDLTNGVAAAARRSGIRHQRELMAGGSCEATAFGAFGLAATGLCLPLGNYHNMGDLDGVEAGTAEATLAPEEISLDDYDGLVRLLAEVAATLDEPGEQPLNDRLDELFEARREMLG